MKLKLVRLITMCLNETYSKDHIVKNLSDRFPIQNGLKQADALSPLLFKFVLEYDIRGARGSVVVTALWYKLEGRGFDT
jgi:hypothetical protein